MPINSNIQDAANGLTGWFLRTPILNGFRNAIVKPIGDILDLFSAFRDAERWKLDHDSTIISLEQYLNFHFGIPYDPATRDADIGSGGLIWIESGNKKFLYVYNKSENRPSKIIYNKSESISPNFYLNNYVEFLATNHFIVWIPVGVPYDDAIVRSLVDHFKLASKTYTIQTY